jgi:hypothetical protein
MDLIACPTAMNCMDGIAKPLLIVYLPADQRRKWSNGPDQDMLLSLDL